MKSWFEVSRTEMKCTLILYESTNRGRRTLVEIGHTRGVEMRNLISKKNIYSSQLEHDGKQ